MKLIADSGSTKTGWVIVEAGKEKNRITTAGLNPYFHTSESVESVLKADLIPFLVPDHIKEIHFYGAGCSTELNNELIFDALKQYFHKAEIHIYHDILGAARALFGHQKGIAAILGTGCNSCFYDGVDCHSKVISLGYLFGDEGAGSYLGKSFLGKYLKNQLPADLKQAFEAKYHYSVEDILSSLYNRPEPNRFLASFSEFLAPNQHHPVVAELIRSAFIDFFDAQIRQYDNYKEMTVGIIGSIAYVYRDILIKTAMEQGIRTGSIIQSPVSGLIQYHQ